MRKKSKWHNVQVDVDKILRFVAEADPDIVDAGMIWYRSASKIARDLSRKARISIHASCGIIAALSPGTQWERNILEAKALMLEEEVKFTTYPANVDKAYRILNGEHPNDVLGGNKVRAFYDLFMNPEDPYTVVVDRHATRICCDYTFADDKEASRFLRVAYDRCADAYRIAGKKLGILPHQAQAIAWEQFRTIPMGDRRWASE